MRFCHMHEPQQLRNPDLRTFADICVFLREMCVLFAGKLSTFLLNSEQFWNFLQAFLQKKTWAFSFLLQIQTKTVCFNVYSGLVSPIQQRLLSKALFEQLSCFVIFFTNLHQPVDLFFFPSAKQVHFVCQHAETHI